MLLARSHAQRASPSAFALLIEVIMRYDRLLAAPPQASKGQLGEFT
jgi:hypothetical protein